MNLLIDIKECDHSLDKVLISYVEALLTRTTSSHWLSTYIYCSSMHHIGVGSWMPSTRFFTSKCSLQDILHSCYGLVTPTYPGPHCFEIPGGDTEHLHTLSSDCESLSWLRLSCWRWCSNSCQHQNFSPPLTGQWLCELPLHVHFMINITNVLWNHLWLVQWHEYIYLPIFQWV